MKKKIYILFTTVLTLLVAFLLHNLIEVYYIESTLAQGGILIGYDFFGYNFSVFPNWVQIIFTLGGILGGYYLGQYWWRLVYIEKRHWRNKNN